MRSHGKLSDDEVSGRSLGAAGAVFIGAAFSSVTIAGSALAVFMQPLSQEFGWGRAKIGAASTFSQWGMAACTAFVGPYVDRWGPRAVLLPLTVVSGLLVISVSATGGSLPLLYVLYALIGASTGGAVGYGKLLSGWFFRHRGLALGCVGIGVFTSYTVTPHVARVLLDHFGWRNAYRALGSSILLVALPVLFVFFREKETTAVEGHKKEVPLGDPDGAQEITVLQAWNTKIYWLLVGTQVGSVFAYMTVMAHAVGILSSRGMSREFGVTGLSTIAMGALIAQLSIGFLLDRFNTPKVIVPFALLSLLGIAVIHLGTGKLILLSGTVLFGLGCGGETSMTSYFVTRFFGVRNFSRIYGSLMPILLLSGAPGPIVAGWIFDVRGSYGWAMIAMEIALALAVACFSLLGPYPFPIRGRLQTGRSSARVGAGAHSDSLRDTTA
jgi:MFS family permease